MAALAAIVMTRYRHYKGGLYELVCEATQESDHTPMIVYRAHNGSLWTRPKSVFFELIEVDGKTVQRFTEIDATAEPDANAQMREL